MRPRSGMRRRSQPRAYARLHGHIPKGAALFRVPARPLRGKELEQVAGDR